MGTNADAIAHRACAAAREGLNACVTEHQVAKLGLSDVVAKLGGTVNQGLVDAAGNAEMRQIAKAPASDGPQVG